MMYLVVELYWNAITLIDYRCPHCCASSSSVSSGLSITLFCKNSENNAMLFSFQHIFLLSLLFNGFSFCHRYCFRFKWLTLHTSSIINIYHENVSSRTIMDLAHPTHLLPWIWHTIAVGLFVRTICSERALPLLRLCRPVSAAAQHLKKRAQVGRIFL